MRLVLLPSVLCLLLLKLSSVQGANILGICTAFSPSHLIVHMAIMNTLAERGHNVTVISALKPPTVHEKINNIIIPITAEEEVRLNEIMTNSTQQGGGLVKTMWLMFKSMGFFIDKQYDVMKNPKLTSLYDNPDTKFDLVVMGWFMNWFQLGLGGKFNAPVIISFANSPIDLLGSKVGNPSEVSYVPNIGSNRNEVMSFKERAINFGSNIFLKIVNVPLEYRMKQLYNKLFSDEIGMPSYAEAMQNVSLILCNSHSHSEGPVRPNVPAIIEIGGIQVKEKPNPLPNDIAKYINESETEVILFSLGSTFKSKFVKPETVSTIYKTLASLKQRVIWKWEDPANVPGNATNILFKKWLPQDDILAHPKIKLFITHAGKGGVAEAQYHGVPMLALPVAADQPEHADNLAKAGFGLKLDLFNLNESELRSAILEIIENPRYAETIKEFSNLYRDRPLTARQSVIYWTEYVIKHRGAKNLQSPMVRMNFIEANNFDLFALIHLVIWSLIFLIKRVIRLFRRKRAAAKEKKEKLTQKKNK